MVLTRHVCTSLTFLVPVRTLPGSMKKIPPTSPETVCIIKLTSNLYNLGRPKTGIPATAVEAPTSLPSSKLAPVRHQKLNHRWVQKLFPFRKDSASNCLLQRGKYRSSCWKEVCLCILFFQQKLFFSTLL